MRHFREVDQHYLQDQPIDKLILYLSPDALLCDAGEQRFDFQHTVRHTVWHAD